MLGLAGYTPTPVLGHQDLRVIRIIMCGDKLLLVAQSTQNR